MDSLNSLLKDPLQDSIRIKVYKQLCDLCPTSENLKYGTLGLTYTENLLSKDKNSKELLSYKAYFLKVLSIYYSENKEYSKLMETYEQRIPLYYTIKDTASAEETLIAKARLYIKTENISKGFDLLIGRLKHYQLENNLRFTGFYELELGNIYGVEVNNPKKALEYYNRALRTYEKRKKEPAIAEILSKMAYQYSTLAQYDSALYCGLRSIKLCEKSKAPPEAFYWNYFRVSDIYSGLNKPDSSLVYDLKCLRLAQQMNDSSLIGNSYAFISQTYLRTKDFKSAEKYELMSFEILKRNSDQEGIMYGYSRLSKMYKSNRNYTTALKYAEKGMELARKLNDLEGQKFIHFLKYECFAALEDHKNALNEHLQYITLKDSLEKRKNSAVLEQAEIRTEFEKQEAIRSAEQQKQDLIKEEEKEKQILVRNSFVVGFILLLIVAALIFRSYRIKQRSNAELTEKNKLIAAQKHLVEEKQKEILDSIRYARRIQNSLLPTEKYITKAIERLENNP